MKKTIKTIVIAVASILFAATSCQKEISLALTDGTITISIQGAIDDFSTAIDTKATAEPVVRVMWSDGDIVSVYDGTQKLGQLKVATKEGDARIAYLTNDGTISSPAGSVLTLVYSNGCAQDFEDGVLSCDISSQSESQFPFVVYATLEAASTITDITVPFKFATSVMKISGTGLGDGTGITEASVGQVNTVCQLTIANSDVPVVAGTTPGTITRSANFSESGDGRATITVALASTESGSARTVNVVKSGKSYEAAFSSDKIKTGVSYNGIYVFTKAVDYVVINGLKWSLENLAISKYGMREYNHTGHINGDYFQWAAYEDYRHVGGGYLLYDAFSSPMCGDEENKFYFKNTSEIFKINYAPYYTDAYQKYDSDYSTLDATGVYTGHNDDVANAVLGGTWRMPTESEFKALLTNTYWAWDATDAGYYVFLPGVGTAGLANKKGTIAETDEKAKAVLFFPATGCGNSGNSPSDSIGSLGATGYYWTSTVNTASGKQTNGCSLFAGSSSSSSTLTLTLTVQNTRGRHYGFTIRPVSD